MTEKATKEQKGTDPSLKQKSEDANREPIKGRVVAYLRTSTEDKGQDPLRQLDLIREWAARNDVDLVAHRTDEGTSAAKTNPFERPIFTETIQVAKETRAEGIVVETVDRFTRQGHKRFGWACVELEDQHNLSLLLADAPLDVQQRMGGSIVAALQAEMGKAWIERHTRAVKSGMKRAAEAGVQMGRPKKGFSPEEQEFIVKERAAKRSWGAIATAINEQRGVFRLVDGRQRRKRGTSGGSVQREWERLQDPPKVNPSKSPAGEEEVASHA
jgi:DNA invertase Pin-like site-specific DNA recombinase